MEEIFVQEGISEKQIEELLCYSKNDKEIIKFTSDTKRFSDRSAFDLWKQNKQIFVLTNSTKDLLGLIWFGKKEMPHDLNQKYPDYQTTFAIRIYDKARGKGLSRWFMEEAFKHVHDKHIWLQCDSKNEVAQKLYAKFGFKPIDKSTKTNSVCMIYENTKKQT